MTERVELELAGYPATVIVKSITRNFGALYEIIETRRWLGPGKVTKSRTSRFLCSLKEPENPNDATNL